MAGDSMYRDHNRMHMHTYKGSADIHAGGGAAAKVFNHYMVIKACHSLQGKSAACVELRLYPYLLKVVFFHALSFYHQRAVKVLAALYRKVQPLFLYAGQHYVHDRLCSLFGGACADALAHYFAGGAAYYQYIALSEGPFFLLLF